MGAAAYLVLQAAAAAAAAEQQEAEAGGGDGHEFEVGSGVGDGQGGLACCSPWGGTPASLEKPASYTYRSTSGLSPREQLERQEELNSSTQDEA